MAERDGRLVAVECDGALRHPEVTDEDAARQAILERAGWSVVRIPLPRLAAGARAPPGAGVDARAGPAAACARGARGPRAQPAAAERPEPPRGRHAGFLAAEERAVLVALAAGATAPDDVFRGAREVLGYARLGPRIRRALEAATTALAGRGLVTVEDGEIFATEAGRELLAQAAAEQQP